MQKKSFSNGFYPYFCYICVNTDKTRECLHFSLMNLGNSLTVREGELLGASVHMFECVRIQRGLLLFSLPRVFLGPISGNLQLICASFFMPGTDSLTS